MTEIKKYHLTSAQEKGKRKGEHFSVVSWNHTDSKYKAEHFEMNYRHLSLPVLFHPDRVVKDPTISSLR